MDGAMLEKLELTWCKLEPVHSAVYQPCVFTHSHF